MSTEQARPKETVLEDVSVERVWDKQGQLLPQLAQIYYQTWHEQGLCDSLTEATEKMAAFNPADTYVVSDATGKIYALVQTLPVFLPSLAYLPHRFPTHQSVESACRFAQRDADPNFVICFSINALPGFRIKVSTSETISLARFLLANLPVPDGAHKVAYSRFCNYSGDDPLQFYLTNLGDSKKLGAVGMHENLGGLTIAILDHARPEDLAGGGLNVLVAYPNTPEEAGRYAILKAARREQAPLVLKQPNHILFLDVPLDYFGPEIGRGLDIALIGLKED